MSDPHHDDLERFLLLYASQTGQALAIAEEIANAAPDHGLKADLRCLSLTDKRFCIENETCAVFIVSTTGDGESPDTAVKFYRRICRHTLKTNFLEKLNYAILALGDSNYIKFCLFGRLLDRRLKALSAKPFYNPGYGDDAFGIEAGVDPWIANLWPALQKQLCVKSKYINGFPPGDLIDTSEYFLRNKNSVTMESTFNMEIDNLSINELQKFLKDFDVKKCRVPKLPSSALEILFLDNSEDRKQFVPNESTLNSKASSLVPVKLISSKKLTFGEDVKSTLELKLQFQDSLISYIPGDSFGFIVANPLDEVELLLERLNILDLADAVVRLQIPEDSINKRKLPAHIQPLLTLRDVFLHCVEIRSVPKKILLRILAEYATDIQEKDCLLFLSSPEGAKAYTNCIRKPSLSVIDILLHYKSCNPPVERLLEYLPCLKPRFYSVASSPLEDNMSFKVVFNVLNLDKSEGRMISREGVCTGWLHRLSSELPSSGLSSELPSSGLSSELPSSGLSSELPSSGLSSELQSSGLSSELQSSGLPSDLQSSGMSSELQSSGLPSELQSSKSDSSCLADEMMALNINCDKFLFSVYKRTNPYFYLPDSLDCPLIMVGPGTGVAPFIGFLNHCGKLLANQKDSEKVMNTWLFYGCRYKDKDFLYKKELQKLHSSGVLTHFITSFSRESVLPEGVTSRYVHESIRQHADGLTQAVKAGGRIFVCGDAKHMAHDVQQAFIDAFQKGLDIPQNDAKSFVEKLQTEHRYINDVWT